MQNHIQICCCRIRSYFNGASGLLHVYLISEYPYNSTCMSLLWESVCFTTRIFKFDFKPVYCLIKLLNSQDSKCLHCTVHSSKNHCQLRNAITNEDTSLCWFIFKFNWTVEQFRLPRINEPQLNWFEIETWSNRHHRWFTFHLNDKPPKLLCEGRH